MRRLQTHWRPRNSSVLALLVATAGTVIAIALVEAVDGAGCGQFGRSVAHAYVLKTAAQASSATVEALDL